VEVLAPLADRQQRVDLVLAARGAAGGDPAGHGPGIAGRALHGPGHRGCHAGPRWPLCWWLADGRTVAVADALSGRRPCSARGSQSLMFGLQGHEISARIAGSVV